MSEEDVAARLDQLSAEVEGLRFAVQMQQAWIERLQGSAGSRPASTGDSGGGGLPRQLELGMEIGSDYCWRSIDAQRADKLWSELVDWLAWLHQRYPLADAIPACWWRHPEMVEELTACYAAWRGVFVEPDAALYAAAEWHERWLPGLEHRLAGRWRAGRCEAGHVDRAVGTSRIDALDENVPFRRHVEQDLQNRRAGPVKGRGNTAPR